MFLDGNRVFLDREISGAQGVALPIFLNCEDESWSASCCVYQTALCKYQSFDLTGVRMLMASAGHENAEISAFYI